MAADTALINAAFKSSLTAAKANVPDLKPLYKSTLDQTKQGLGMISKAIGEYKAGKEKDKADKNKGIERLQGLAGKVYKSIYEMKETLPEKVVTAVENEVMRLQEEYQKVIELGGDDAQEGSRALARIEAQYEKIKNEALNLRESLMLTTGAGRDNAWNFDEISPDVIDPLATIFDFENIDDNDNVSVNFVNGKITFTTAKYTKTMELDEYNNPYDVMKGKPISFNADQIREMLPSQSREFETFAIKNLTTNEEFGKTDAINGAYNWDENRANDERNSYICQIKTKGDFQSAKSEIGVEGIQGLEDALISNIDVQLSALNNTFVDVNGERLEGQQLFDMLNANADGDSKEVLDKSDVEKGLSGENKEAYQQVLDKLIKALTNIHDDAFNLDTSTALLADYHVLFAKQHYDNGFIKQSKANKRNQGIIPGEDGKIKIDF